MTSNLGSLEEGYRRIYAIDLLDALWQGDQRDFNELEDHELYEWVEVLGYTWTGNGWTPED
jgi:hypothetical protein